MGDPRFATNHGRLQNRSELDSILERVIPKFSRPALLAILEQADVPVSPVNTVDQLLDDPQTLHSEVLQSTIHSRLGQIQVVATPIKFSGRNPSIHRPAPTRGEHTEEVLTECGYSHEEIHCLRRKKVVI
jgi:crotonobetainyl-CoA:carnitine CoA-transferase CaiB-like acyl-CoA transferase